MHGEDTKLIFHRMAEPLIAPQPDVEWASTMTLNPSILEDQQSGDLHMLFRASGPWEKVKEPGKPLPYPIFLGYAVSRDSGVTWEVDFSRPCLAPELATEAEQMWVRNRSGDLVVNYANGCLEDPRMFFLEGKSYVAVACRMFAPGPYWENDVPLQCAPDWATDTKAHSLGRAATENLTVTVLYEINLQQLAARNYDQAFQYVTHLSDPERGDNRDVFLFSEKLRIDGVEKFVCLHRPMCPANYGNEYQGLPPAMMISAADRLEHFAADRSEQRLLARSQFEWEGNRVGASWVPIHLGDGEWLLAYHAKQDTIVGYTQSFMILAEDADGWPVVKHRCSERLLYASEPWELEGLFSTPCLFTCGGVVKDEKLIMSYGAADTVAGVTWAEFKPVVNYVRKFDSNGSRIG